MGFIKSFHAVLISEDDQKIYGFLGPDNKAYQYVVLPISTRNSPALFSEFMAKSLEQITEKSNDSIRNYQDDVAIAATTIKETTRLTNLAKDQRTHPVLFGS
eukprot:GHVP01044903.1.p1 GENE.GHVP01044903.1~~GHVP01044903.1.p1  ORF type:complete len:102 (-),score=13.85 GHVP01044903.1:194-499(-)